MGEHGTRTAAASSSPGQAVDAAVGRIQTERGTPFLVGPSFYKPESTPSRDLAVLAALVYKRQTGRGLRVLDVMSGCGVRGARYLDQAGADFVWVNDAWDDTHAPLVANLSAASRDPVGWHGSQDAWQREHSAALEREGGESAGRASGEVGERQRSHSSASTSNGVHTEGRRWGPGEHSTGVGLHDGTTPEGRGTRALKTGREAAGDSMLGAGSNVAVSEGSPEHRAPERNGGIGNAGATPSSEGNEKEKWTTAKDSGSAEQRDPGSRREPRWRVSHLDATKLLNSCSQNSDFYDIVDIDSFGSDSAFLGDALRAVRYGGMVYVTSTDGFALAGGHRPAATLAAYGSYARPVPFGNEMGLRILMGTVIREGAMRGLLVRPLFSHFAPHGPVFRAMLRVEKLNKGDWGHDDFAFVGHCFACGQSRKADWKQLGNITCSCTGPDKPPRPMAVVGPMWTGPLHCAAFVEQLGDESTRHAWAQGLAEGYGRRPSGESYRPKGISSYSFRDLDDLLALMREEAQTELPPYLLKVDDIYKLGRTSPVNKMELCEELRKAGFVVARSHVSAGAIKTNASMAECIEAAKACHVAAQKRKEEKAAAKQ